MNIGDEVTWMVTRRQSHGGIRVSLREGAIVRVENSMALVRCRNGRRLWLYVDELRKAGEKTAVMELFERVTEGISSAPAEGFERPKTPDAGASDLNMKGTQP